MYSPMLGKATYNNAAPLRPSGSRMVDNWEGTQGNTLTVKGYGEMVFRRIYQFSRDRVGDKWKADLPAGGR